METRVDSVVAESKGLGALLAANMHPRCLFNIVVHVSRKKGPKPFYLTLTESARVSIIMHFRVIEALGIVLADLGLVTIIPPE
jgi:hypothetical protein